MVPKLWTCHDVDTLAGLGFEVYRLPPSRVEVIDHEELSRVSRKLLLVSDGGVRSDVGSFGWVIGTDRQILVRGKGRAFGSPMTSFRAETFACWDALRWLHGWFL